MESVFDDLSQAVKAAPRKSGRPAIAMAVIAFIVAVIGTATVIGKSAPSGDREVKRGYIPNVSLYPGVT